MQSIIVEKPYRFVPPHRGNWIPNLIQKFRLVDWYLSRFEGIESYEIRGADFLRQSLAAGHGILLTANHCRYADPIAMGWLAREVNTHVYAMASWHLFNEGWWKATAIRLCGGFSVYREGVDRKSLDTAIETLVEARRPLVLFPEGTVMRSNDMLQPLLDGVSFMARSAAKKRAKLGRGSDQVVVHPVAIKYLIRGDVDSLVKPAIEELEQRLLIGILHDDAPVLKRIQRLSEAQLALGELRVLGRVFSEDGEQLRRDRLVEHLLSQSESRWELPRQSNQVLPRIKLIRIHLVKHLVEPESDGFDRKAIWRTLQDLYLAQQIVSHPVGYLDQPTDTRVLETVERIEEDMKDASRVFRPLHAVLQVAPAITVPTDKVPKGESDPLVEAISSQLKEMLAGLATRAAPYHAAR